MRLGVLGGAFNPPHMGHLVLAQEALVQLKLESVVFMPMGQAPHREIETDPGGDVRFELCEAAVAGDDRMSASRLEEQRIFPRGRYGAWTYNAMEDCILAGREIAERLSPAAAAQGGR